MYQLIFILCLLPVLFHTSDIQACACCMPHNHRSKDEMAMTRFEKENFVKMNFSRGTLVEHMGEADPVFFKGFDSLDIAVKNHKNNIIVFEIFDSHHKLLNGSQLHFEYSNQIKTFVTDTHPYDKSFKDIQGYKEIEVDGVLSFSGAIEKLFAAKTVKASLLLQGSGNLCWNERDYKKWSLRFKIKKSSAEKTKDQTKQEVINLLAVGSIQ